MKQLYIAPTEQHSFPNSVRVAHGYVQPRESAVLKTTEAVVLNTPVTQRQELYMSGTEILR